MLCFEVMEMLCSEVMEMLCVSNAVTQCIAACCSEHTNAYPGRRAARRIPSTFVRDVVVVCAASVGSHA